MSATHSLLADYTRIGRGDECEICGHAGTGYCLRKRDGTAVICPRVESPHRRGAAGWFHRIGGEHPAPRIVRPPPRAEPETPHDWLAESEWGPPVDDDCAARLGVTRLSLEVLGARRYIGGLRFPMRDEHGACIGIRTRAWTGEKRAVTGSHNGLFIPAALLPDNMSDSRLPIIMVVEGPTDTAAILSVGILAVGLPSNAAGIEMAARLLNHWRPRIAAQFVQRDKPGSDAERGTLRGMMRLRSFYRDVKAIRPPPNVKDARAWLAAGMKRGMVEAML